MTEDLDRMAEEAFEALGEREEPAAAGADNWQGQLAKACWFLRDARRLATTRERVEGRESSIVELSLSAAERTVQAVLMEKHAFGPEKFRQHIVGFQLAGERKVISRDLAFTLEQIWRDFRNENYYRSGNPSRQAAERVLGLAEGLHRQLARRKAAYRGVCRCPRE